MNIAINETMLTEPQVSNLQSGFLIQQYERTRKTQANSYTLTIVRERVYQT
jgi:hypothetical protein